MKEQDFELQDQKLASMFGWNSVKITSGDGSADRIYYKQGRCFLVERKKPEGRMSRKQRQAYSYSIVEGTPHYVLWDTDIEGMRKILIEQEGISYELQRIRQKQTT